MKNSLLTVFIRPAEHYFLELQNLIPKQIGSCNLTPHTTVYEIDELSVRLLNQLYHWPKIIIQKDGIEVSHSKEKLHLDQIGELLPPYTSIHSIIGDIDYGEVTEVIYKIPFSGDKNALELTVSERPSSFPIEISGKIKYFFYSQRDIKEFAEEAKKMRNFFIDKVNQNQTDIDSYFQKRADEYLAVIRVELEKEVNKLKKDEDENLLLL